jgi:hypothetical protein
MVTYLKSGWSDLQWTGWMKGLSRCAQSSFHTGYYPRRSTLCAVLAPSGAPTTGGRGRRNMRLDFAVMKLYRSNVEAKKLMTRMVMVRALSAFSASLSQPRDARRGYNFDPISNVHIQFKSKNSEGLVIE